MKLTYEVQIGQDNDGFWMNVMLSNNDSHWSAETVRLVAKSMEDARLESFVRIRKLIQALT